MDLLELALGCAEVVSLALAPFWALAMVWGSSLPHGERFAAWLGLSVAFCMMWTLPLHTAVFIFVGAGCGPWVALAVVIASVALGAFVTGVYRRRVAGEDIGDPRLAWACLAFGAAVALLLAWTTGSRVGDYASYAVPVGVAMATQAWLLLPPNVVTRAGACGALAGIVGAAPLLGLLR